MARLGARLALRRSRTFYLEQLQQKGFAVEAVRNDLGETLNCRLCGYTNLRFDLAPGFEMTACSTLGQNVILHQEQLKVWSEGIPRSSKEALAKAAETELSV
ncbi:MAG: hypothetical protein KGS72_06995 [Cyanobacteria bacterium REEB67]|nr:hypothetical protein [Cyanobacteria bacterium REEB67]